MAGAKKKKKPAANPARGFATTSIASKPRPEVAPEDAVAAPPSKAQPPGAAPPSTTATTAQDAANNKSAVDAAVEKKELSPEEFEKQLEEGELQVLVEKYSTKVKRDSQRQCNRLETEKRLLRGTGDLINCPKWLPEDIMTHLLDLIKAEGRFATTSSSESPGSGKMPSEEDMVIRLWTLQATLAIAEFAELRVQAVVKHILDISPSIAAPGKDLIWGLEEALEWLARECDLKELPPYENKPKPTPKDTPVDTPVSTRASTPKPNGGKGKNGQNGQSGKKGSPKKKLVVTCDSDIEPDNLVPEYLTTKRRLFELERNLIPANSGPDFDKDLAVAKAEARLRRIEEDVLFDKFVGEQEWRKQRVAVEREIGTLKKEQEVKKEQTSDPIDKEAPETSESVSDDDSINSEAQRIASEILAEGGGSDDDDNLGGLFDSLPQNEVDQATGKAQTVVTSSDGQKVIIRDFGKWTGVSPRRVLEEACRSRDPSVRISYNVVSEASFASRQSVGVVWTKLQDTPLSIPGADVEIQADANSFNLTMSGVANPDFKQSEAYAATTALFYLFSGNARDEKVALRLPPAWRDLFSELTEAKKTHLDAQDRNVVRGLRDLVRIRRDQELEDGVIAFRGRNNGRSAPSLSENASQDRARHNGAHADIYRKIWADKSSTPKYRTMIQGRMQLPMWSFRDEVLRTVDQNQVTIVCGETGCGKSTQVPSFLLEHELSQGKPCKIYCTEPRRISAISLAKRVSEELGENRNDIGTSRSLVGYSIRLEANTSRETRLIYATTGIVLRMLEGSTDLGEITHLVLDEVHERTIDSDFLLIALKRLMEKRKDFKVILMSATVDADKFSSYLGGAPVLNVPGRTFPVEVRYLEDALQLTGFKPSETPANKYVDLDDEDAADGEGDGPKSEISKSLSDYPPVVRKSLQQLDEYRIDPDLIVQLIAQIATKEELQPYSKAILVFLPGIAEIRTLNDLLLGNPVFAREWVVYPLHSTIATEDQESAFLVPPPGMRKVVLATNIAETGITIPDVTCVIDTGKHREMRYDERRQLSRLIDTFISRANAKQRRGRAGRVQNGLCFHMFTRYRHDNFMNDSQTPEMLRLSLQDLAIRIKICKIGGIEETLNDALDPPSAKNIRRAVDALIDVRALTAGEDLTPLGQQLARLPLDVFLGKLILLGSVFKCLDMALTVAAILSAKSPFTAPFGQRAQAQNAKMLFRRGDSDLLTVYNAYLAWKRVCQANSGHGQEFQFCRKNFLSQQTLANIEDLKGQLLVALADSGFLMLREDERKALNRLRHSGGGRRRQQQFFEVPHRVNVNSDNDIVSSSVMAWSFYPKLLVRDQPGTRGLRNIGNNQSISLHPSSVNRNQLDLKWLSYYHIMQAKSVYHAHETTAAEPFAVALLCGDVRCDMFSGVITLDGNRGRFALPDWKTMLVVKILRARLREVLTRCFKNPGKLPTAQQEKWLEVWQKLFSQEFTQNQDKTIGAVSKA